MRSSLAFFLWLILTLLFWNILGQSFHLVLEKEDIRRFIKYSIMASGLRELNETLHFFRGNSLQVFLGTLKHWADRQIKDFVSV